MSNDFLPVQLPSKCLPYPDVKPEDILIRTYNGGDEMLLAQINPANLERNFLAVLKNVIQGIDPVRLTTGDRLYLIIWEYINSYSEFIKINDICSHCLKSGFNVNLKTDLQITYLPDEYSEPQGISLPSGKTVQLRILNIEDEVAIEKMAAKGQDPYLYRFARSITDCDNPFVHMERMKEWSSKDIAAIRKFHSIDTFHGPKTEALIKCPHCGEEEEVLVPFRLDFLYPVGEILGDCVGA